MTGPADRMVAWVAPDDVANRVVDAAVVPVPIGGVLVLDGSEPSGFPDGGARRCAAVDEPAVTYGGAAR